MPLDQFFPCAAFEKACEVMRNNANAAWMPHRVDEVLHDLKCDQARNEIVRGAKIKAFGIPHFERAVPFALFL